MTQELLLQIVESVRARRNMNIESSLLKLYGYEATCICGKCNPENIPAPTPEEIEELNNLFEV